MSQNFPCTLVINCDESHCGAQLVSAMLQRAKRAMMPSKPQRAAADNLFQLGHRVPVNRVASLNKGKRWHLCTSNFYGPCTISRAKHPAYVVTSEHGRVSRSPIHALGLVIFKPRLSCIRD